jgi:hypothetical protein
MCAARASLSGKANASKRIKIPKQTPTFCKIPFKPSPPLYYWIAVTYKICVRIKKNIRNALIPL